jgi:hypothetical protein
MGLAESILSIVKNAGGAGMNSVEVERALALADEPDLTPNKVTAALYALKAEGALRREPVRGEGGSRYRYWYVRERALKGLGLRGGSIASRNPRRRKTAKGKAELDLLITLPIGANGSETCTLAEARAIYKQLHELFGTV